MRPESFLTLDEQRFNTACLAKFKREFKALPSDSEFMAAAIAGKPKRGWYRNSQAALESRFGVDAPRFAALLAALSPQCSLETNLKNAIAIWDSWVDSGRPDAAPYIIDIMGFALNGHASILPAWIPNAVRALSTPESQLNSMSLSGPKVESFRRNLTGDHTQVTCDSWMAKFAGLNQFRLAGTITKRDSGKRPVYLALSAKIRRVAYKLTKSTGSYWTPAEVQETIWSWIKTASEYASRTGQTIAESHGQITHDDLKNAACFAILLGVMTETTVDLDPSFEQFAGDMDAIIIQDTLAKVAARLDRQQA